VNGESVVGCLSTASVLLGAVIEGQIVENLTVGAREEARSEEEPITQVLAGGEHLAHQSGLDNVIVSLRVSLVHQTPQNLVAEANAVVDHKTPISQNVSRGSISYHSIPSATVSAKIQNQMRHVGVLGVIESSVQSGQKGFIGVRGEIEDSNNHDIGGKVVDLKRGLAVGLSGIREKNAALADTSLYLLGLGNGGEQLGGVETLDGALVHLSSVDGSRVNRSARAAEADVPQRKGHPRDGDGSLLTVS
jgi:hypothetical protein